MWIDIGVGKRMCGGQISRIKKSMVDLVVYLGCCILVRSSEIQHIFGLVFNFSRRSVCVLQRRLKSVYCLYTQTLIRSNCPLALRPSRRTAQSPITSHIPNIVPHARNRIEQIVRVVLVLDRQQPRIVGPEIVLLPRRIVEVALVDVGARPGRDALELRHNVVRHRVLRRDPLRRGRRGVPLHHDVEEGDRVPPRGDHGVRPGRVADAGVRQVGRDAVDEPVAVLRDVADRRREARVVALDGRLGDDPPA